MQLKTIQFFAKYIERELGIIYSDFNQFQLQNRLEEITKILGLADGEALYQLAQLPLAPTVRQLLLDTATNNETSFFRDPRLFRAVENLIVPPLLQKAQGGPSARVWCAACSTGQEPYSLAMMIHGQAEKLKLNPNLEIVATDISQRVLERARRGRYSQLEVQRGLPSPLLVKHFQKEADDFWTINSSLRQIMKFDSLNLLTPFDSLGKFDLIFCRNVLIYQSVPSKVEIIRRLRAALRPGGYLVLGAGESLIGLSEEFQGVKQDEAIVYQAKEVARAA